MYSHKKLSGLLISLLIACCVPCYGKSLFSEKFNQNIQEIGRGSQSHTALTLKHGSQYPGWTKQGTMPVHFVQQSDGDWALMIFSHAAGENILTLNEPFAANKKGTDYTISVDVGPGVYEMPWQATRAGDKLKLELLRKDDSVLKSFELSPRKWDNKNLYYNTMLTYKGDGSGGIRFRISPVGSAGRCYGAIDHLQVFASEKEAKSIVSKRLAKEKKASAEMDKAMEKRRLLGPHAIPTPQQIFSTTLEKQLKELKENVLMKRFAVSRKRLASDPYRPAYHFVTPESTLNDPTSMVFWKGRWHLFFIAMPPDEFPNPADIMKRWHRTSIGHAVSDDLVHWEDLPYAINPGIERACYSGGFMVDGDRVIAYYPGIGAGQMVAISDDPLLLNWKKHGPVNTRTGDSCIWKEGDTYYGLTGNKTDYIANVWWPQMEIWSTKDLITWNALGNFIEDYKTPFTTGKDEAACPDFKPIGDKYFLSFFSHTNGGQYFLGDYDKASHRFKPYEHGRFNHGKVAPGGVHAASVVSDGKGGLINILNINHGKPSDDWDQMMSVPQHLTLGSDKRLRISPIKELKSLRGEHKYIDKTVLPANKEVVLEAINGSTMELKAEIDPKNAPWVQLKVLRSPDDQEYTTITFYNYDKKLSYWYDTPGLICLDGSRSTTRGDVTIRPPEKAAMARGSEPLKLRIFIDRSIVEVFANGKQYLAMRVYPGRADSVGVSIRAQGQDAVLNRLDAWRMQSIWP